MSLLYYIRLVIHGGVGGFSIILNDNKHMYGFLRFHVLYHMSLVIYVNKPLDEVLEVTLLYYMTINICMRF